MRILLATLIFALPLAATAAEEPDEATLRRNFAGLDGVAARCVVSTKEKYAERICEMIAAKLTEALEGEDVPVVYSGVSSPDEHARQVAEAKMASPLELEFHVRGTSGGNVGSTAMIQASVAYDSAVEVGSAGPGRSGRLLLWQEAVVAEGPRAKMAPGIGGYMQAKLGDFLERFVKYRN
ncbi:MAG: hypothetical protein AB7L41_00900 [Flavobacteriaceae bacterium]